MLAGPVLRTILLQRTMSLPSAVSCPSPLLLPRHRLLLGTLRLLLLPGLLWRLGPLLLLLRLLSPLLLLLRRLLSPLLLLLGRLLGPLLLLLLRRLLSPLLLRRLLGPLLLLLFLLLPFRLAFLIVLRTRGVNRPDKHEQGSRTDHSNKLHRNRFSVNFAIGCARRPPIRPRDIRRPIGNGCDGWRRQRRARPACKRCASRRCRICRRECRFGWLRSP